MSLEPQQQELLGDAGPHAASPHRRLAIILLGVASAAVGFSMAAQMGLQDNFLVEQMHFTAGNKGLLEAARESCGIFALGMLALLAGFTEPIIASAMLTLLGAGLIGHAFVYPTAGGYIGLVVLTLIWSQGLHVWMPLPNSMMLAVAEPGRVGHRLGQMQAAGSIGSFVALLAFLIVSLVFDKMKQTPPIRAMYFIAGVAALVGALACLGIPRNIKTPGPRLIFRRAYGLFYVLNLFEGWRKQICLAFSGYLLVNNYHTTLFWMLLLWLAGNLTTYVLYPHIGRLIDRAGERRVSMFYYACVTVTFTCYALLPLLLPLLLPGWLTAWLLRGVFLIDIVSFALSMAQVTYIRRIAPPEEHTATLSMGVAVNHVTAVLLPLAGAALWTYLSFHWVFAAGAAVGLVSIAVSARLPKGAGGHPKAK